MGKKKGKSEEPIVVPAEVRGRARKALASGDATAWVDHALWVIGHNVTHRRPGEPHHYEEARLAAEVLLALVIELRSREI